jgi:hypothetical protein
VGGAAVAVAKAAAGSRPGWTSTEGAVSDLCGDCSYPGLHYISALFLSISRDCCLAFVCFGP